MTQTRNLQTSLFLQCSVLGAALLSSACGSEVGVGVDAQPTPQQLAERAYVVSAESDELFVADLGSFQELARIDTGLGSGPNANHMAVLGPGARKVYVLATEHDAAVVVDAQGLGLSHTISLGAHPTHAATCMDCGGSGRDLLWVVNEGAAHGSASTGSGDPPAPDFQESIAGHDHSSEEGTGSVTIVDMATDAVVATIRHPSLQVPHFVRFYDGRAYVPSIGGNQVTVIDTQSLEVTGSLQLRSAGGAQRCSGDPCGFADAQIDSEGVLFAAHIETGEVLVYDAATGERGDDLQMGDRPWAVFVDSFDTGVSRPMMPNWGDSTVSVIGAAQRREVARSQAGDAVSYGVNYSPLAPRSAFVMGQTQQRVAIVDRDSGDLVRSFDLGGTVETASTTADGRYLLLPLSNTGELSVLNVETLQEVVRFDGVGLYPWSVVTAGGQNYCH